MEPMKCIRIYFFITTEQKSSEKREDRDRKEEEFQAGETTRQADSRKGMGSNPVLKLAMEPHTFALFS